MTLSLVKTKLLIPPLRLEQVGRPRLIARLNEATARRLTLISAPAGFGKTTLLGEWAWQAGEHAHRRTAWLALDDGDNDVARFWAYVIAALQTLHTDFGAQALALLHTSQPASIELAVTALQ
jgi:LuxR family maltose regulon positive regulatory protein